MCATVSRGSVRVTSSSPAGETRSRSSIECQGSVTQVFPRMARPRRERATACCVKPSGYITVLLDKVDEDRFRTDTGWEVTNGRTRRVASLS